MCELSRHLTTFHGYGAWYAFMQQRGTPVQRWQKPFSTMQQSTVGDVKIDTSRRSLLGLRQYQEKQLGDRCTLISAVFSSVKLFKYDI